MREVTEDAVTVTSTTPVPAGATAVIEVVEFTVKLADADPKRTALTLIKFVPEIATEFPPAVGPEEGLRLVMVAR